MFNLQGSELIIILLLALVVLGPEKLPEAMRKLGQFYAELKKMSSGFQQEFRNATDEPLREIRETANTLRDSMDFKKFASGEREEKPKSAEMAAATPTATAATMHTTVAPADPDAVPTTDLPNGEAAFAPPAPDARAAESDVIGPPVMIDPVDIAPETLPPEDQVATAQVAKAQVAKDQVAKDQVAKDQVAKDQVAKDQVATAQVAKDQVEGT